MIFILTVNFNTRLLCFDIYTDVFIFMCRRTHRTKSDNVILLWRRIIPSFSPRAIIFFKW